MNNSYNSKPNEYPVENPNFNVWDKEEQEAYINRGSNEKSATRPAGTNPVESLRPTSIGQLKSYSQGVVVQLPDFSDGQPLVARIKRPSLLGLAKNGEIPNSLMATANELFATGGRGIDKTDNNMLKDMYGVMESIAKASLVEPTYDEILSAGMSLTDEQLMVIFNYSQEGIKALDSFRSE